jgi:uncharacterized protein (DUF849 family)
VECAKAGASIAHIHVREDKAVAARCRSATNP